MRGRRWNLDFSDGASLVRQSGKQLQTQIDAIVAQPPGQLQPDDSIKLKPDMQKKLAIHQQRQWELAKGPGKQIFMTLIMLYMMGNGAHFMTILFTFYQLIGPLRAIFTVNAAFERIQQPGMPSAEFLPKVVFIFFNGVVVSVVLYKLMMMGLLPTMPGDWLGLVPVKEPMEFSAGGRPIG